MLFSDFIKDSLLGKNNIAWNYYHHANINTDNILHADTSAEFIREYFTYGGKELPLLLNLEDVTAFIELLRTLETRKHLLLFFPYKFEFQNKYDFLSGIAQIQNALNSDFRCAMQYRTYEVGTGFDTYVAFIYDGRIVFMINDANSLSYIDSVNLTKSPIYIRLLNYGW